MQNRGAHISVQPGRAGVPADESNPRVRDCYSATLLLEKVEQNLWPHLFERCKNKKYVNPVASSF